MYEQSHDLDKPKPPGSPMRRDAPDADVNPAPVEPGTPKDPGTPHDPDRGPGEPDVVPSSTPDGPQVVPAPSTPPGEPGPDPEPATEPGRAQLENAATSLDEPSDATG